MTKLLTIAVPAYNSANYLAKCLDSLKGGGRDLEVLIINDGSSDDTAAIAERYQSEQAETFRLINKSNGGHGSAVNCALAAAQGQYFRVVDSDDWVGAAALEKLLTFLRQLEERGQTADMIITNYIYEYSYNNTQRQVRYANVFTEEFTLHSWADLRPMRVDQFFAMHSLNYRTAVLRACNLQLPEHCFYVDNIFDYIPVPKVETIAWLDADLYHYFIGRDDQSVHTPVMIKRIDQQLRVTYIMLSAYHLEEIQNKYQRRYMYRWLSMIMAISQIHLTLSNTRENLEKIDLMWQFLRNFDPVMYKKIRLKYLNLLTSMPGKGGRYLNRRGFFLIQRIFKFS